MNIQTLTDAGIAARPGPLNGLVVLDITRVVAGPYCAMLLADLGATVIKVENPGDPDYARGFPPFVGEDKASAFFAQYNRNKLGITLDLKSEKGKALLKTLVRDADVLIENFRPGTMDKLGLGYEVLAGENPKLVYTALSGFGRKGPNSRRPAFDNTGQATGGLWSMNGMPDEAPIRVGTIIGDLSCALYGVIGTLAAVRQAERTGKGDVVDISQQDSVLSLTENAVVRYTCAGEVAGPLGNDHPFVRPYGQFPCKDGYVFFGGYTDKFWRATCALFGEPECAEDPEIDTMQKRFDADIYARRVRPLLEKWFAGYSKAELEQMAGDDLPLSAIKTIDEVVEDPHVAARDMIVNVPLGAELVRMFGLPVKLDSMPQSEFDASPEVGQHNDLVWSKLGGLTPDQIAGLKKDGVI